MQKDLESNVEKFEFDQSNMESILQTWKEDILAYAKRTYTSLFNIFWHTGLLRRKQSIRKCHNEAFKMKCLVLVMLMKTKRYYPGDQETTFEFLI